MKIQHPILLLSLSFATALTLLADASPAARRSNTHTTNVTPARPQHQQRHRIRSEASLPPQHFQAVSNTNMASTLMSNGDAQPSRSRLQRRSRPGLSVAKSKRASGAAKIAADQVLKKNRIRPTTDAHSYSTPKSTDPHSSITRTKRRSLVKRALPTKKVVSSSKGRLPTTPLLLLPDSRSVWHTGSYQTVQWSRKYARNLPKDTTVDIVLVDANTNRKILSLKRFIPFRKGSAQVWVPVKMPEGVSFVLVLELYRGRSQEQVTTTISAGSVPSSSSYQGETAPKVGLGGQDASTGAAGAAALSSTKPSSDVFSTVVRRSDINISSSSRKVVRDISHSGTNTGENVDARGMAATDDSDPHHDINDNDYYHNPLEARPYEFQPEENREEFPNTVRPLELEHTFGLHQKVYTMTPYTLEWRLPSAVQEILDYAEKRLKLMADKSIDRSKYSTTFQAKIMVELVKDQTLETVSVLARNVPAETRFQYLSIQDKVSQAFYRLRVQMVVVQIQLGPSALASEISAGGAAAGYLGSGKQGKAMEGWEFPEGGEVIDRYEAITRRFWVSQGAL
ncbi:hypothetical protein BGZ70_004430 [Mortierella alpina]|uniref:Uncharacterized protein n=1 Tax=Mortierella alpina TaxID=64518 RepID=A0A9P6J9W0_MORAP|nr:hypothetical protein BGZ70_004430 [Mortierella alpina]